MPIASRSLLAVIAVALSSLRGLPSASAGPTDTAVSGVWLTHAGDARIQVSRCGTGLCGKVVWLKQPVDPATGKAQVDNKNHDPSLRSRPILGLQLFIGMKPSGDNVWSGQIYNADDGQSYASTVTSVDADRLEVRGCVAVFCGSETWTRVSR